MFRITTALFCLTTCAAAQKFALVLGNPVAAGDRMAKTASLAIRTQGCAEGITPQVAGKAEGIVAGARRSVPLNIVAMSNPGVFAI